MISADQPVEDLNIALGGAQRDHVYIPDNEYSIPHGYYNMSELGEMLHDNADNQELVEFIATMMMD